MNKECFTQEELDYINADIYDTTSDIYAYHSYFTETGDGIYAKLLPAGRYNINISSKLESEHCVERLHHEGINANVIDTGAEIILDHTREVVLPYFAGDITQSVISLRKQAILNQRKNERLIAKAIKTHTNYGEDYNRESLCDTADCELAK